MSNKYYTPDISELYIGFECEIYTPFFDDGCPEPDNYNPWSKEILCERFFRHSFPLDTLMVENIRVKYLDKSDIEECGFRPIDHDVYELTIGKQYIMLINSIEDNIHLSRSDIKDKDDYTVLFNGNCTNKSKLKQILTMINISVNHKQ